MVDLDDLFAYKSVRVAKIRNRWLGILHFTFMFLIFFYIVICNLILKKGWLEDHEPVSSLRLQLKSPTDVDLDRHANATHMPKYCGAGGKQCVWWNERQLVYPSVENNAMLVTTRVTIETMTRPATCVAPLTKECMWKMASSASSAGPAAPAAKPPPLYPVEPERCTLLIQHHTSLRVGSTYIFGGGKGAGMKGKLIDQNGKTINPCDDYLPGQCPTKPEYKFDVSFGKPETRDIIPIQTILRAAGTNLQNNLEELSGKVITKRNAGMVIICELQYTNKDGGIFDFSPTAVSYEMSCNHVPKADFKVYEKVSQTTSMLKLYNRHGIRLLIRQTGRLGVFSFQHMLLTLVASIGLIAVSTTIVDFIMMNILKPKEEFKSLKIATSRDFYVSDPESDPDEDVFRSVAGVAMPVVWRDRDFYAITPPGHPSRWKEVKLHNLNSTGCVASENFVDPQAAQGEASPLLRNRGGSS